MESNGKKKVNTFSEDVIRKGMQHMKNPDLNLGTDPFSGDLPKQMPGKSRKPVSP